MRAIAGGESATERGTVVQIASWESSSAFWGDRQREFDQVLAAVGERLLKTGVNAEEFKRLRGQLELRVVLNPVTGMAGLCITTEALRAWASLGADLYIEA